MSSIICLYQNSRSPLTARIQSAGRGQGDGLSMSRALRDVPAEGGVPKITTNSRELRSGGRLSPPRKNLHTILLYLLIIYSLSTSQSLLHKANEHYENGEYLKAIATYSRALQKGENPALAYFNLGNTYYRIDSLAKAVVCYQTAIQEAPEFFRAYLNLGILYYNLNDMAGTATTLEYARTLDPENIQILLILASAYKSLHAYSLTVPLLEQILERDPSSDDCYFLLYEINYTIGDLTEAREWLLRYPKNGKRITDIYQLLGELAEETGDLEQAVFYFSQLTSLAPQRKWPHYQLVRVLHASNNVLTAMHQADMSLEQFSDFSDLALLAGNIAFKNKFFLRAEKFYRKAYSLGNAGGLVGLQNLLQQYTMQNDHERVAYINDIIIASK